MKEVSNIEVSVSIEKIREEANKAAEKGALEAINEFYTGRFSPYKQMIETQLREKTANDRFTLPDIIATINERLSQEIDQIANRAVAKSFVPLVKRILSRESGVIKFSQILKKFIEYTDYNEADCDLGDYKVEKRTRYGSGSSLDETFPSLKITSGECGFQLFFFRPNDNAEIYRATSLPVEFDADDNPIFGRNGQTMKVALGEATLEMPFTPGVLDNDFMSFVARLVIGGNDIEFDTISFEEDMFED